MNKRIILMSCALISAASSAEANDVRSHTFFSIRPVYQTAMPEKVSFFRNDLLDKNCDSCTGIWQVVPFGGSSTDARKLAKYFLPNTCNGCCIEVSEFNNGGTAFDIDGDRHNDIEASHFNIETRRGTFRSRLCFLPKHKFFGVGFTYRQPITRKEDGKTGWWGEVNFPIVRVKNSICLREYIIDNGGGAVSQTGLDNSPRVGNMIAAFKQRNWKYGRIDNNEDNIRTGIGDIELTVGYDTYNSDCCNLNAYVGAVLPTGNRPRGEKVFEAIVGNNHHFGIMFGNGLYFNFWKSKCWSLSGKWDINNRFLFSNHQVRSFDLVGKQWGRYMETYSNRTQAVTADLVTTPIEIRTNSGTSGINVFTRRMKVNPQFSTDINTAWVLTYENDCGMWMGEAGFNFYARQAEKVELESCCTDAALKSVLGLGRTTFTRTIRDNAPCADFILPNYKVLSDCDFDLESAAHPAILSYILYGTFGYQWKNCPSFVGLGASYETESVNTVLRRWMVWCKVGYSF